MATLTPEDIEQLDCARDVVMAAGFSLSSVRPYLSASRQSNFDTYDYVSVSPNTRDTTCAPLSVNVGQSVMDADGNFRHPWGAQSVAGSDVRNAILERCDCRTHEDSTEGSNNPR